MTRLLLLAAFLFSASLFGASTTKVGGSGTTKVGGSGTTKVEAVPSPYDADAQAFFTAVVANSGTISDTTKGYVNTFVLAAKANSYWTKLNRINLFCGDQLAAALVPLKIGGGSATDTNVNFVGGDYTEATGLTGNGTTKYLNTGLNPSVSLSANDTHIAVYRRGSTSGNEQIGLEVGANTFYMFVPLGGGVMYSDQYNATGGAGRIVSPSGLSTPYGFLVGSRTTSTAHEIYRNATSLATNATSGGSLPSGSCFVFAGSNNGSAQYYNTLAMGAYSFGSGLTDTDVTNYYNDLQAFQTSLGRNV